MKSFFVVLSVLCAVSISGVKAQKMQKGSNLFDIGLGFSPGVGLNASFDHGLVDTWGPGIFTIGGVAGFQNWGENDYRQNSTIFAVRATYRYPVNNVFEVYGTVATGLWFHSYSKHYSNDNGGYGSTTVGCRYSFASNMGVFAEVGWANCYLNGGLSISF